MAPLSRLHDTEARTTLIHHCRITEIVKSEISNIQFNNTDTQSYTRINAPTPPPAGAASNHSPLQRRCGTTDSAIGIFASATAADTKSYD